MKNVLFLSVAASIFLALPSLSEVISKDTIISNDIEIVKEEKLEDRKERISKLYPTVTMDRDHLVAVINLCYKYEIDPDLVLAIIEAESRYNPKAKNPKSSAIGYGQLIKSTATSVSKLIPEIKNYQHYKDGYDPYINLHITTFYISKCLLSSGGNVNKALRHYRGVNDPSYFRKVTNNRIKLKNTKSKILKGL